MAHLAIVDIGKSNTKLSIVNAGSGALLSADSTATRIASQPLYPHIDTEQLWQWLITALATAQKEFNVGKICVTAHGATFALVDDNSLVLPVMDYEYAGPDEFADEYDLQCDAYDLTYSPKLPHGLNAGRQLYWQRKKFPEQFSSARHLLPYPQYWSWRLTGVAAAEVTTIGSHSDLWFPASATYSDFARREGFVELIPELRRADETLGILTPDLCNLTGISQKCEVLVGVHDSNASLVPYLKSREYPFTVMSTGTWVIIFAVGSSLSGMIAKRDCAANVNIHGEAVACARFMGGREFEHVAGADDNSSLSERAAESTVADLEQIVNDSIFALPAFTGEGGPYPDSKGCIVADRPITPTEQFALASLYCALLCDVSLELCSSQGDIIVEGAYARNSMLLACLEVFRPTQGVLASSDNTGTTTGTTMLATDNHLLPELTNPVSLPDALSKKLLTYQSRWRRLADDHAFPGPAVCD